MDRAAQGLLGAGSRRISTCRGRASRRAPRRPTSRTALKVITEWLADIVASAYDDLITGIVDAPRGAVSDAITRELFSDISRRK
ncbi:hypothetical protein SEA_SKINNYPETE_36 [Mycobacterium phage SkinnyPete]|uniref:Uncharacterized protein n=1 Tax=Mycobacterium phage SkinnyPete TaxID=1821539 RepID=A0A142UN24_9CAUD|nr:hypothetical protein FDG99_gp36 [Mycobacterium phage SkinnyPete]AMU78466.1 hypothetical protein SEA_SKINNYPETE_36 [Mycobacterium phage SkinnyPete]